MSATIYPENGVLVVRTPYHPGFVAELKTLPAGDRRFDPARKVWLVTPNHGQVVAEMVLRHFGQRVRVPDVGQAQARPETRVLEIRYIGTCKDRGGGDRVAFGWMAGGWNVLLPEQVLRDWFGQESRPGESLSLYAVLSVKQGADEATIKSAYRRLAKQWHPDVSREPDAAEQFRAIQHAYDILRDAQLRRKYDAGLALAGPRGILPRLARSRGLVRPWRCAHGGAGAGIHPGSLAEPGGGRGRAAARRGGACARGWPVHLGRSVHCRDKEHG